MGTKIRFPKVNVPILGSDATPQSSGQRVLFIGQKDSGSIPNDSLYQDLPVNENELAALVGGKSMLFEIISSARKLNKDVSFDVIVVSDGVGATVASSTITLTASSVQAGELTIYLGSATNGEITVSVADGEAAASIASKISAAINAKTRLPYASTVLSNVVTVTTVNKGSTYNQCSVYVDSVPSGVTAVATSFSDGTVDPDVSTSLDLVGDLRYQTIVWPYADDIDVVQQFLDDRFNADGEVKDGVAICGSSGTFANLKILGSTFNSNSVVVVGVERLTANSYNEFIESPWVIASQIAAIRSLRLQSGTNIARFVITKGGALDAIGGPALCSKPYANTPMPLLKKSIDGLGFDKLEVKELNDAGITVVGNNKANNGVILGQVVTTYKNDNAGNPDITYKFLNYVDTASTGREFIFSRLESDNAQSRLTSGDLIRGRSMTNAETIAAAMVGYYQELSESDYVVARKGEDELAFFKSNLLVETDQETGSATVIFKLPIVTQLREINAPMTLTFNIQ